MQSKYIWPGIIIVFFIVILGYNYLPKWSKEKKISGVKTEISNFPKEDLIKPPKKNDDFREPIINAKAALLVDVDSAKKLYSKNSSERVPIASTTKIMTGLVVLENYPDKLKDVVMLTSSMVNIEGSEAELRPGEKMTVSNLLKGLLIVSGNDAAYSLAGYLGGKEQFVKLMNDKAALLGLKNTFYLDPAGLNDEGYSTAEDLAHLGAYAMRNKIFSEIVKTSDATISSIDGRLIHRLTTSNRLLKPEEQYYYPSAIGIKTGFTPAAGHCLVAIASQNNHELIAVILNTDEDTLVASAKESRKLLEWGFANWQWN